MIPVASPPGPVAPASLPADGAGGPRARPGRLRRRKPRVRDAQWQIAAALLVFFAVSVVALGAILAGTGWWFPMVATAAVILGAGGLMRMRGLSAYLAPFAELGVLLLLLTLFFGQGSGLLWLIPTATTFDRFESLVREASTSITVQNVPANVDDGILFLLVIGAGVLAILIDGCALALRAPALAGAPMLIPLAVPGLLIDGGASTPALVLAGAAYLALLMVDQRMRRRVTRWRLGGSAAVGGIGIVAALVLGIVLPPLNAGPLVGSGTGGLLFGSGISPLVDIGRDLRRPDASPVLHYTTTAESLPYFKLLTLDRFVGTTWTSESPPGRTELSVEQLTRPPGLGADVATTESKTAVVIDGVATTWLPAPSPAVAVDGLNGRWFWNDTAEVITSSNTTTRGQDYTVTALQLQPTAEQLRTASTSYPEQVLGSLEVPSPRPAIIDDTAQSVTADTSTPYDAAVALQDYLRSYRFSYDTKAPVQDGAEGGGVQVIGAFLESKTGYCVHFASAMAIMARTLGIPARVAVGYLPGARDTSSGVPKDTYLIDSHDLHAWPELYFVGIGWVPFEPTPSRGTVPDYAKPNQPARVGSSQAPVAPTPVTRPSGNPQQTQKPSTPAEAASAQATGSAAQGGLIVLGAILLLMLPMIVRRSRRSRRRTRIRSGQADAGVVWLELTDTALDHFIGVSLTETPRAYAARLAELPGMGGSETRAALERILIAEERDRYDRRPETDRTEAGRAESDGVQRERDLLTVVAAIHSGASRRNRIVATLFPASLLPRSRGLAPAGRRNLPSSKA
jgi:transglutaminase-like putative cysteine protease